MIECIENNIYMNIILYSLSGVYKSWIDMTPQFSVLPCLLNLSTSFNDMSFSPYLLLFVLYIIITDSLCDFFSLTHTSKY